VEEEDLVGLREQPKLERDEHPDYVRTCEVLAHMLSIVTDRSSCSRRCICQHFIDHR